MERAAVILATVFMLCFVVMMYLAGLERTKERICRHHEGVYVGNGVCVSRQVIILLD